MTLRASDSNAEQELAKFLDKYLYKNIPGFNARRVYDRADQLRGIDMILTNVEDLTELLIDEKAQLHYINNNLPTFVFEIDSIQRGYLAQGWLFNEDYETTHYMIIYPNANHENTEIIKEDDFTEVECLLIERDRIIAYLDECGWNQARIEGKALEIRNSNIFGKYSIPNQRFSFFFTERLIEKPINIVIHKSVLKQLSCQIFNVSKNGI